ncbi:unknown [Firmicutes bacterium CAG:137]|nr:unknown [Firmicutes bacterium CAG:137]
MEPHGNYHAHVPHQGTDDLSVPHRRQKQLGATDQLRHRLGNLPVLIRLQEEKHRRHPVGLPAVLCGSGKGRQAALRRPPGAQGEQAVCSPLLQTCSFAVTDIILLCSLRHRLQQGWVRRHMALRAGYPQLFQLQGRIRVPQCNEIHTGVQHLRRHPPVQLSLHRPNAAAVHHHPAALPVSRPDAVEVEPQGSGAGGILNQAAASADEQLRLPHPAAHLKMVEGIDAGRLRLQSRPPGGLGHHAHRKVRIAVPQLL